MDKDYQSYDGSIETDNTELQTTLMQWCNEAYDLLRQEGLKLSTEKDRNQALLAMRRMLGLFIEEEEYEKCILIKQILEKNFKGELTPLFDYKELWENQHLEAELAELKAWNAKTATLMFITLMKKQFQLLAGNV